MTIFFKIFMTKKPRNIKKISLVLILLNQYLIGSYSKYIFIKCFPLDTKYTFYFKININFEDVNKFDFK